MYQETIEMFRLKYFLLSVDHILWQLPGLIHQAIFNYSLIAQHEEHAQRGTGQYETKSLSTRLWILLWFFFFFFLLNSFFTKVNKYISMFWFIMDFVFCFWLWGYTANYYFFLSFFFCQFHWLKWFILIARVSLLQMLISKLQCPLLWYNGQLITKKPNPGGNTFIFRKTKFIV